MPKKKVGRPRIEFDLGVVEGLCRIGASIAEMASVLPASKRTIADRLADTDGDSRIAYAGGWSQPCTGESLRTSTDIAI